MKRRAFLINAGKLIGLVALAMALRPKPKRGRWRHMVVFHEGGRTQEVFLDGKRIGFKGAGDWFFDSGACA